MGIISSIKELIPNAVKDNSSKLYLTPDIEEKKLNNAMKAMGVEGNPTDVVAILDTTLFQTAKTGLLFMPTKFYVHESFESPQSFDYDQLTLAIFEQRTEYHKDKEKQVPYLSVAFKDGRPNYEFPTTILDYINGQGLAAMLNELVTASDASLTISTENEDTEVPEPKTTIRSLEDLPASVKLAYVQLICNFALQDDQEIDSTEYRGIISLAARIELPPDAQRELNSYLIGDQKIESNELLKTLLIQVNEATQDILHKSIMKDVLSLDNQKDDTDVTQWRQDRYLSSLAEALDLSADQVDFLIDGIQHDQNILGQRLNDTQIKKQTKDLAAKAAAVGIPMAALYFSGSVVGVGATGITSGLAALGFGGILGFSGMVTGIGVLLVAGTLTYKGVQHLTGRKDVENNKQREALLQQIIRNTQRTLNYLIDSVNDISRGLIEASQDASANQIKIAKMTRLLAMLSKGAKATTKDLDHYQSESVLTNVPVEMDAARLKQLTQDPTTKQFYAIVMADYEENENGKLLLKPSISSDDATALHGILDKIGYLSVKGVAKSGLGTAKTAIKGMFD